MKYFSHKDFSISGSVWIQIVTSCVSHRPKKKLVHNSVLEHGLNCFGEDWNEIGFVLFLQNSRMCPKAVFNVKTQSHDFSHTQLVYCLIHSHVHVHFPTYK